MAELASCRRAPLLWDRTFFHEGPEEEEEEGFFVLLSPSPGLRSRLTGLLLFLSLLSYPLSILCISLGGGGGGGGRSALPPLWLLGFGRVLEEPDLLRGSSSCALAVNPPCPSSVVTAPSDAPSGLYPACRLLVKILSMFSASLLGFHAGRYLPVPEPLDLDSLLVLSASQSLLAEAEEEDVVVVAGVALPVGWW